MVLEHLFPEDWLEYRTRYSFIMGAIYSVIGLIIASFLFPGDPALVAVAFTSMLLLPELYKIFSIEERQEGNEKNFSVKKLWLDDINIVKTYIFLFLGILMVYSIATLLLPNVQNNDLFREQLEIRFGQGFSGQAVSVQEVIGTLFPLELFWGLLSNNFLVLLACFILALLSGDGAIFLITWNASVWGTIFGITAKLAGAFSGQSIFALFGIIMLVVFPHMMLEAISYFLAAIAGSIISKDVILEEFASDRFWSVFSFNLYLLLAGLVFLVLGAGVEAFVLEHVDVYREIIEMSVNAASQIL